MATEKQARMIRALQRQVGGKMSSMKQLAPMTNRTVQDWVLQLRSGINPYDHTEGSAAVLKTPVQVAEEKLAAAQAELDKARAAAR